MSISQSPTPSLSEAKRQRKQLQQDSILLNNRIKLLQIEEQRTWKKIEEMKSRQRTMEEIRRKNEETAKIKLDSEKKKESKRIENNIKISKFKEQSETDKKRNLETIFEYKKKSYAEIRELREKIMKEKYQMYAETVRINQQRSKSVRVDHKRQAVRLKKLEKYREEENKADYLRRVQEEERKKKEIEGKVIEMEILEMELIKKLQNTQLIQAKTLSELEASVRKKPMSAMS